MLHCFVASCGVLTEHPLPEAQRAGEGVLYGTAKEQYRCQVSTTTLARPHFANIAVLCITVFPRVTALHAGNMSCVCVQAACMGVGPLLLLTAAASAVMFQKCPKLPVDV